MAMATSTALLIAAGIGTAGVVASSSIQAKAAGKANMSSPIPLPQAPSTEAVADKASGVVNKKRVAASQSVFTSPLGVSGEAQVARKTLLGQ